MSQVPHTSYSGSIGIFSYEYNLYPNNMLEIIYYNKVTGHRRIYHIYFDKVIDMSVIEKAVELAKQLYIRVKAGVAKPNIPLYALLYVLNRRIHGFSYRCKIKKKGCPVRIYRVINGREVLANTSSLLEQMYRILKKYPL